MKIDLGSGELQLYESQPLRLFNAAGVGIRCLRGTLWITQAGVAEDIFLNPGELLVIQQSGLSLVESIGEGSLRLQAGPGRHWICRFREKLALTSPHPLVTRVTA